MRISEESRERVKRIRSELMRQPEICVERAYYMMESYKQTEGYPAPLRRAMALDHIVSNMSLFIGDDELLVGHTSGKVRGANLTPEQQAGWYMTEIDHMSVREVDRLAPVSESDRETIREITEYWAGKCVFDNFARSCPPECRALENVMISGYAYSANNQYYGHFSPDYETIIHRGTEAIAGDIEEALRQVPMGDVDQLGRRHELTAMKMTLESCVKLAGRYSDLAEEMAKTASPQRAAELLRIAETCRHVPARPARTLYEAFQSAVMAYIMLLIENLGPGTGFMRPDQYLYPYFQADMKAGRTSEDEAYLLASTLYAKCNDCVFPYNYATAKVYAGFATCSNVTLGGIKEDGSSAVNELSYIFLEAEKDVALNAEDVVIRVADNTPEDFLINACEAAKNMQGKLKFVGDGTIVDQMLVDHRTLEDARNYAVTGCNSPTVPGASLDLPGGIINVPLLLELALNNGVRRVTGEQMGPRTGDPREFTSYEQVWEAFRRQAEHFIPMCHMIKNLDKKLQAEILPGPFLSTLYPECVRRGVDYSKGGTAPNISFALSLGGVVNVGDALMALKRLVFEDKKLSMSEMVDALDENFEGREPLLAWIAHVPKFGNNDPEVDGIVNDVIEELAAIIEREPGYAGAISTVAASAITSNVPQGTCVGALPNGRHAGAPFADGGISPDHGCNVSGAPATMLSVANLNHMALRHGSVLNMRFDPAALKDDEKVRKFVALLRTYFRAGGFLVQFNIVSADVLRAAQEEPENYRDLLVRVSTYSARFVELGRDYQNDIIERLEFSCS